MSHYKHKRHTNSISVDVSAPFPHRAERRANVKHLRAPRGMPWIWLPKEIIDTECWRALPFIAHRVLHRIMVEHLRHAGKMNGHLIVTYNDFKKWGVRRESVPEAVEILIAAGLVRVKRGKFESADRRRANKYTLTWISADLESPTNDFRRSTAEKIRHVIRVHREKRKQRRALRERHTT